MNGSPDRRRVLKIIAAAAVAATAQSASARASGMDGTITFEGGKAIPEGFLEITLEDRTATDQTLRRIAELRLESDGKSTSIDFSLPPAGTALESSSLEVVVRLERTDGWLIARASAPLAIASPIAIALYPVMY